MPPRTTHDRSVCPTGSLSPRHAPGVPRATMPGDPAEMSPSSCERHGGTGSSAGSPCPLADCGARLRNADVHEVGPHGWINGNIPKLVAAMSPEVAVIERGRPDYEAQYCAWAFGHPRHEVVAMLETGITTPRVPVTVRVGTGAKAFVDRTVTRAEYATGWEGTVVVEARGDGALRRVAIDGGPRP